MEMILLIHVRREEDIPLLGLDWVHAFKLLLSPGARLIYIKDMNAGKWIKFHYRNQEYNKYASRD